MGEGLESARFVDVRGAAWFQITHNFAPPQGAVEFRPLRGSRARLLANGIPVSIS